jgi:hypothetical protein
VFTHVGFPASAPHITSSVDGHTALHDPLTHACPVGQVAPHLPQFSVSRVVSTQASPHNVCEVAHVGLFELVPVAHAAAIATTHTHMKTNPPRLVMLHHRTR